MAKKKLKLTSEQKKVFLFLGSDASSGTVKQGVLEELIEFGLVYMRSKTKCDFTDSGEALYEELTGEKGG